MFTGARNVRSCAENWPNCDCPYKDVVVPDFRPQRKEVFAVSGQYYVPVLQDGDVVLSETDAILAHLESKAEAGRPANG